MTSHSACQFSKDESAWYMKNLKGKCLLSSGTSTTMSTIRNHIISVFNNPRNSVRWEYTAVKSKLRFITPDVVQHWMKYISDPESTIQEAVRELWTLYYYPYL